ncbi:hypothetical protein V6N13_139990 [Hibiscus sabdariffa]|uniref:BZIP domain-containing protein n=1 Tax=Hibiscus sabdariffa TaxID=183260 RepID=A0ABR2QBL0_9ROSI
MKGSLKDEKEAIKQRACSRSRMRKQAECDELTERTEALKEENAHLRSEVSRLRSEYEQLHAENTSPPSRSYLVLALFCKILELERLGEVPGHKDLKSGRNDQHRNHDEQTETVRGSHQVSYNLFHAFSRLQEHNLTKLTRVFISL